MLKTNEDRVVEFLLQCNPGPPKSRGTWGVEPEYGSASFQNLPSSYTVKRGDGGVGRWLLSNHGASRCRHVGID